MELTGYFIKVTVCLTVFALIYHTCLRKLTFFNLSRIYLLASLIFSFIIPLLHFEYERNELIETISSLRDVSIISDYTTDHETDLPANRQAWPDPVQAGIGLYALISLFLFVQLLWKIIRILINVKANGRRIGRMILTPPVGRMINCSFFNIAFINRKNLSPEELEQVLAHEYEHMKRLHSADKLLIELLRVILWFNPLIYYYRHKIAEVHEFEVDAAMISRFNKRRYASMLLKLSSGVSLMLANSFSRNKLEIRISRLFTHKSSKMKKLLYLSFFPAIVVLGFYLSVQVVFARIYKNPDLVRGKDMPANDPEKDLLDKSSTDHIKTYPVNRKKDPVPDKNRVLPSAENERIKQIAVNAGYKTVESSVNSEPVTTILSVGTKKKLKVVLDPGHGGKDNATRVAGIYEKDLTLEVAKEIRKVLQERGFKVILTRETDEFVSLYTRAKVQGDIFISLHANSIPNGNMNRNGMEIHVGSTMDQGSPLLNRSVRLAQVFHNELRKMDDIQLNEAIFKQSLVVLRANVSPAILVELGYMSHPDDLKFMTDKSSQRKIADAFAEAISAYN